MKKIIFSFILIILLTACKNSNSLECVNNVNDEYMKTSVIFKFDSSDSSITEVLVKRVFDVKDLDLSFLDCEERNECINLLLDMILEECREDETFESCSYQDKSIIGFTVLARLKDDYIDNEYFAGVKREMSKKQVETEVSKYNDFTCN